MTPAAVPVRIAAGGLLGLTVAAGIGVATAAPARAAAVLPAPAPGQEQLLTPDASVGPARQLPRAASTLIVQPASIGVVAKHDLRTARFTVQDGCGRTLTLGATGIDGRAAAVPLPAQGAGPGTWRVSWTGQESGGGAAGGRWEFDVAQGDPCPGTAGAAAAAAARAAGTSGHSHGAVVVGDSRSASVTTLGMNPVLATVLGVLAGLGAGALGLVQLGRLVRRGATIERSELIAVVGLFSMMLTLAAVAGGNSLLVRFAIAVPSAIVITAATLSLVSKLRAWPARMIVAGWCASLATTGVVLLVAWGQDHLTGTPSAQVLSALPWQVASVGLVAVLLTAGGWLGRPVRPTAPPAQPAG